MPKHAQWPEKSPCQDLLSKPQSLGDRHGHRRTISRPTDGRCAADAELRTHRRGLRFAYQMCSSITLIGTVLHSIPVLAVAATTAFFAMFPPNHPFDNVYNATLGRMLHPPTLPPRTAQSRFACSLATPWLIAVIVLFAVGMPTAATVGAAVLLLLGAPQPQAAVSRCDSVGCCLRACSFPRTCELLIPGA